MNAHDIIIKPVLTEKSFICASIFSMISADVFRMVSIDAFNAFISLLSHQLAI